MIMGSLISLFLVCLFVVVVDAVGGFGNDDVGGVGSCIYRYIFVLHRFFISFVIIPSYQNFYVYLLFVWLLGLVIGVHNNTFSRKYMDLFILSFNFSVVLNRFSLDSFDLCNLSVYLIWMFQFMIATSLSLSLFHTISLSPSPLISSFYLALIFSIPEE